MFVRGKACNLIKLRKRPKHRKFTWLVGRFGTQSTVHFTEK